MSGPVDLGQTYRYRHTVKDSAGVAANAGALPGGVVVTVTLPDGTTATPSVVNSATGIYDVSYTTTQSGLHNLSGSATGGILSAEFDKWEDVFTVETPLRMFVGVDEAVNHLRSQAVTTSDADREQLRWLCMVASEAVEGDLGRAIIRRTVTETHTGGGSALVLRQTPVISVTSVTVSGVALLSTAYLLDSSAGILYCGTTAGLSRFSYGALNVVVVYVAGYANPPRAVRMVALTAVQSLWQSSQQASHIALDEAEAEFAVSSAVAGLPDPLRSAYESLRAVGVA